MVNEADTLTKKTHLILHFSEYNIIIQHTTTFAQWNTDINEKELQIHSIYKYHRQSFVKETDTRAYLNENSRITKLIFGDRRHLSLRVVIINTERKEAQACLLSCWKCTLSKSVNTHAKIHHSKLELVPFSI